jgi:hypothetical protein
VGPERGAVFICYVLPYGLLGLYLVCIPVVYRTYGGYAAWRDVTPGLEQTETKRHYAREEAECVAVFWPLQAVICVFVAIFLAARFIRSRPWPLMLPAERRGRRALLRQRDFREIPQTSGDDELQGPGPGGGAERAIAMARGCRVITVPSGGFKTIPGWLRTSLVVTVISRSCYRPM